MKKSNIACLLLCGGIFTLDQALKRQARKKIEAGNSRKPEIRQDGDSRRNGLSRWASGRLLFHNSRNYGACLNAGERHPRLVRRVAAVLTAVSAGGFMFSMRKKGNGTLKLGLSLLTGGALSNLVDRYRDGYVTDYVSFPKAPGRMKGIVYNIGDFAIGAGTMMVAGSQMKEDTD